MDIPEEVFWQKTPKTLAIYLKAYEKKKEYEAKRWSQQAWEIGAFVLNALNSTVVSVGLWNGKKPPKYVDCPHTNFENNPNEKNEQWVKNERLRLYAYLKSFGGNK